MKTTIFICAHKQVDLPENESFLPIQAGAALHEHIVQYQPDDEGDNISYKNPHFCELTCHYWAWKNLKNVNIVGLNHYRRFFDFERKWASFSPDRSFCTIDSFIGKPYLFPDLDKELKECDIILPPKRHYPYNVTEQYGRWHISEDWEMLRTIIKERHPEYIPAFEKTMDKSNGYSGYNMFITSWKWFDTYSTWLFDILFEVEKRCPPKADPVQSRIYGYMSERLINVFCEYHELRIKHVPIIMPIDTPFVNPSNLRYTLWKWRDNFKFLFYKSRK
ncbi:MAG: DUF4422 domain-containing protein [Bacteroidaceae bacterium]|nr:DUF4422 domain-containing protein [Bacteroidaceae bacterium]